MLLPNRYSFKIIKQKTFKQEVDFSNTEIVKNKTEEIINDDKRDFIKLLGGVGVGAAFLSMMPSKAQALIIGSSPTAGIVGVKNSSNVGVNPATEDGNLALLAAKDFATETSLNTLKNKDFSTETTLATRASETTLASIKTNSDKFLFDVDGNLLTAATGSANSATKIKDSTGEVINPATEESLILLRRMLKQIDSLAVIDSAQRQRVTIDSISNNLTLGTVSTVATVTTVNTVTTVSNVVSMGGVDARFLYMDTARNAYANSIRSNLINT